MNLFQKIAVTAGILAVTLPCSVSAFEFDYNAAEDFNVYTFGNFYGKDGSIQGRTASGGSLSLTNYSVADPNSWPAGTDLSDDFFGQSVIAAGAGAFSNVTVNYGDAIFAGGGSFVGSYFNRDATMNTTPLMVGTKINGVLTTMTDPVDGGGNSWGSLEYGTGNINENFITAKNYFVNYSNQMSGYGITGNTSSSDEADGKYLLTLNGSDAPDPQVFNLTAADLANAYDISLTGVSAGMSVIINVDGQTVDLAGLSASNTYSIFQDTEYDVLFNFYNADVVNIEDMNIYATLLAPEGTITAERGSLTGKLIANNFWSNDEFNFYEAGTTAPVPEPSTYVMMALGLGMLGLITRRRMANK